MLIASFLLVLAVSCSSVYAITGDFTPDSTPCVGVVVLFADAARQVPIGYCTGFLLSPTVMLTAGHSCVGVAAVSVCFDQGPISYIIKDGELIYSTNEPVYNGVPTAYPEYLLNVMTGDDNANSAFASSDLGVIVLDEPVTGVTTFAALPNVGFSDSLPTKTSLKVIGYGVQYQITPRNNGPENAWVGYVSRNSAQVDLKLGNFAGSDRYIRCSANPGQDKGGIAFGDSGGPVVYTAANGQETVIAVNAYVNSASCAGVTYHTRIDVSQILTWINGFMD